MTRNIHTKSNQDLKISNTLYKKYFFYYIKPYTKQFIYMLAALTFSSSSVLVLSKGTGYMIDRAVSNGTAETLNTSLFYSMLFVFLLATSTGIRFFFITTIGEYVIRDIRRDIYKKILELSPSFYEVNKPGAILSRLTTDTTILQDVISSSLSLAIRNAVMLIGSVVMLLFSSLKLTLITFCIIPIVIIPIQILGKRMRSLAKLAQDKVANLSGISEETINFIRTVQAYNREEAQKEIFDEQLAEVVAISTKRIAVRAILTAFVIGLVFGAIGFILWIGGHDVISGKISVGTLSSFVFLTIVCAASVTALTETFSNVQKAIGASERIVEFLLTPPDIASEQNAALMPKIIKGEIEFHGVSFYYSSKPTKPALDNVSFKVKPNQMLALVGESGAGKSTIIQLLLRFYDVSNGKITIDGHNIKNVTLNSLREHFSYVGQDPVIFSGSVLDNILYGKPHASYKEVVEAARASAALDFIEKLPDGFHTFLGEKGVRLSGGQKQRITIARAILKNAKILLLDEATSALDEQNEALVQQATKSLMKERTVIVIAHRLSTIRDADGIITLTEGKLIKYEQKNG